MLRDSATMHVGGCLFCRFPEDGRKKSVCCSVSTVVDCCWRAARSARVWSAVPRFLLELCGGGLMKFLLDCLGYC